MTDICELQFAPLGKKSAYINQYDSSLLFPIPRQIKREEIKVPATLPFKGFDLWNAYELSWLNLKGKPQVALASFVFCCESKNIIESKSFKLYLNSFNNTKLESIDVLQDLLLKDLRQAAQGELWVQIYSIENFQYRELNLPAGSCLDNLDLTFENFRVSSDYLQSDQSLQVHEILYSNLLKSNCLVTGQPDWGTLEIEYRGPAINKEGLLRYIVSFRDHNEFHEQCVERIFMDLQEQCKPQMLTVKAYYTRRGGLDINPVRSTEIIDFYDFPKRMARQ